MAVHSFKYGLVAMLYRHIKILYKLVLFSDNVQQFVRYPLWIAIKRSYPLEAVYLTKCREQFREHRLAVYILAIACCILRHNYKLRHAVLSQPSGFLDNILHASASVFSSYRRDSAVSAVVAATLGYLYIRIERLSRNNSSALH